MRRPTPAFLIACAALFVALGGPATAARLITSQDVKNGSLQTADLSKRAQRALKSTPSNSVTQQDLAESAVTTRALAPGAVLSGSVGDESLTASDLAANAVDTDEVAEGAVGQSEIRNNGVGASEIADQSIDTGEVIDGALLARDVARFSGMLIVDFSTLGAGQCQAASVTGTQADIADADISNDLIVISPGDSWPTTLTYGVKASASKDQFLIYACNPAEAGAPQDEVDPPSTSFRYAIIGSG